MTRPFPDHPFLRGLYDAGPVAVARLDTRVPGGFHGSWVPAQA